jgi:PAS domain S-box-containing protein
MNARRSFRAVRWGACAALVLGASGAAGLRADRQLRTELIQQARMVAASICHVQIAALTGTPADFGTPPYLHFKARLAEVRQALPDCRFAYLMARRADGAVVFLVDNEPDDSPDCSPPGQVYTNLTEELLSVLAGGEPVGEGPHTDPRGTWVSALAAIASPDEDRPVLVGLDVDARRWKWIVAAKAAVPAGFASFALLLAVLVAELSASRRHLRSRQMELEASERRLLELAEQSRTVAWEIDAQGRYTYVSPVAETVYGYRPGELVGNMHFYDLHPEPGREAFRQATLAAFARREPFVDFENAVQTKLGPIVWVTTSGLPLVAADGALRGYRGNDVDVTARKRAEEALRENDLKLRALFAAMDEIVALHEVVFDADGQPRDYRLADVNEAFLHLTGLARAEAVGKLASEVYRAVPPPYLAEYAQVAVSGTPCRFETHYAPLDKHFQISAVPLGRNRFATIAVDVTAAKRAEARLRALLEESNQARQALLGILEDHDRAEADLKRLATAIEQSADSIVVTDAQAAIQYVNPAFEAVTGYRREEAVGQNPRILQSGQQDAAFYRQMWAALAAGQPWKGRLVNRRKDGTLYTEEAVISPVVDAQGRIVNYVAVKRDVTEQLRQTAQLQQAQKMDSIGRLAGGVAHDFNNMLTVILGSVEMALLRDDLPPPLRNHLEEARRASMDSAAIVRQLQAFARNQTIVPRVVDLNQTVADALQMIRRLIGETVELGWRPAASLWPVKVDPAQIDQVLVNLCLNARDAIAGNGRIDVATANAALDPEFCAAHPGAVPGDYVEIAVRDTGCGMDPETLAHAFEPFYTTKAPGKGTGLGLPMVYGIVKQNGGYIDVASQPGQGTAVHLYFPRQTGAADALPPTEPRPPAAAGRPTVLLVEDELSVLAMTAEMLDDLGYDVRAARSPVEAIRLVKEHPGEIHLLLTDVVMPGMNGRDLARTLQDLRPGLRYLFMSGYTADVIARNGVLEEGVNFIHKPFTKAALAAKIRDVLATGSPPAGGGAT